MNATVLALKRLFHEQKEENYNPYEEAYVFGQYTKWIVELNKQKNKNQLRKGRTMWRRLIIHLPK